MTFSITDVSLFQKELAVTSLLSCILIFISHIYGIHLIVIIILSSKLRSLSKRDARARRAGDDAAVRQPSYRGALSFQRLKCLRVKTKTKCSHFHQPSFFFSLSPLEHAVGYGNRVAISSVSFLLPRCVYSICLYLSLELLED